MWSQNTTAWNCSLLLSCGFLGLNSGHWDSPILTEPSWCPYLVWGADSSLTALEFAWWPASPEDLYVSAFQGLWLFVHAMAHSFYTWHRGIDSGPHAGMASTLMAEWSSQTLTSFWEPSRTWYVYQLGGSLGAINPKAKRVVRLHLRPIINILALLWLTTQCLHLCIWKMPWVLWFYFLL